MAPTVAVNFREEDVKRTIMTNPMGKSRKYSKGNTEGFVPSYRHVVESEGLGHVDADMTGSDDSREPKRKCISLNSTGNEPEISKHVLAFSNLTRSERKDLNARLKRELEQVRDALRRLASMGFSGELISPESDIRSTSKKPVAGKKIGGKKKRVEQGRVSNVLLMKQCETLLCRLMSQQFSWVFNTPVDTVKLNIPDYHTIIKQPMDLGTVKSKLVSGVYSSPLDFVADVRLTFANAKKYNPPGNDVHYMADTLSKYFEVRWKSIEKKVVVSEESQPMKKAKAPESVVKDVRITDEEKQKLSADLMGCIADDPQQIVEFLKARCPPDAQTVDDEIELDIDALDHATLLELRKLVDQHLKEKQKSHQREEVLNEPGVSTASFGGNEAAEGQKKGSKSSTSSSSSSESGSSRDSLIPERDPAVVEEAAEEKRNDDGAESPSGNESKQMAEVAEEKGENPPSEKPLSPDKAYRAAILRSRFADTIFKAREKALEKGEKRDPEVLRLEREELERREKEERAKLQAEAKAAEEARMKAEAEAAAEAKRKREIEREAARQALLQMEKTVEINENCKFMDDLEMLRAVNDEEGGSFTEENSPEISMSRLGSFKNPLEQLGLYMKADEEEDDEENETANPPSAPDVEEGEID